MDHLSRLEYYPFVTLALTVLKAIFQRNSQLPAVLGQPQKHKASKQISGTQNH